MKKGKLSNALRRMGLIWHTDKLRYGIEKIRNLKENKDFLRENPKLPLPPDYLIYESYQMNYRKYYEGGREYAEFIRSQWEKHIELKDINILDWGCGPARVIRHLPQIINNCSYYGTDYNANSIQWCRANLEGIEFNHNDLEAKLPYADNFFGLIYGHSIITHLSEEMHYAWIKELNRVLHTGGILYLTSQGENYRVKLDEGEKKIFDSGELVVRGKVKEGHRTYSAFQPNAFMKKLFTGMSILDHITFTPDPGAGIPQDIWILRKD